MHNSEARALKRAVALLMVVSALRWGWSSARQSELGGDTMLAELLTATREATEEEAERSTPLEDGERIDPNLATEIQLDRLPGVGPATARSIVDARDSGVVFGRADDLLTVRGVGPSLLGRIRPFLDLSTRARRPEIRKTRGIEAGSGLIDINRADIERLQDLPGVGPAIAARIVEERSKQMFISVDDLERVHGLGPSTVDRLRSHATVGRVP